MFIVHYDYSAIILFNIVIMCVAHSDGCYKGACNFVWNSAIDL